MKNILIIVLLALTAAAYADVPGTVANRAPVISGTLPINGTVAAPPPPIVVVIESEALKASGVTRHPILRAYRIHNANKKVSTVYFWNESGQVLQVVIAPGQTVEPIQPGMILSSVAGVHYETPKGVSGEIASGEPVK